MTFSFDLISDLHVETWDSFDWSEQPTSPYCVVAGDVARDRTTVIETLNHLGKCYQGVFYIDGNDEHRYYYDDLKSSYQDLTQQISKIPNVVFMQDHVIIINGVAILATNGWWTYDFDPTLDHDQCQQWFKQHGPYSDSVCNDIMIMAYNDATYLKNSIHKLQTHQEVKSIVVVSHTVPAAWLTDHDIDLVGSWRYNCLGSSVLSSAIDADTEHKIKTWCFGHYHKAIDRNFAGIRYVSNCRGRGDGPWKQSVYYPKRIEVSV